MIFTHPGKIGDALYSLPTMRKYYHETGEKAIFWTSAYCAPLKELFEAQECVESVVIDTAYIPDNHNCGTQPYVMKNAHLVKEETVTHLGFSSVPRKPLPIHILESAGFSVGNEELKELMTVRTPPMDVVPLGGDYIALGAKTLYKGFESLWEALVQRYNVITVGTESWEGSVGSESGTFLKTAQVIKGSRLFVGTFSSMLALANFCHVPRIVPYNATWSLYHGVAGPHYMENADVERFMMKVEEVLSDGN